MVCTDPDDFDLTALDEKYQQAESVGTPVADSKYDVVVEKAEITKSKTSGNPMLTWWLRIIGPTESGRLIWKKSVMAGDGLKFLKGDLKRCGVELSKLSELPGRLHELLDLTLSITKKTVGEYERIYINSRIKSSAAHGKGLSDDGLGAF